MFEITLEGAGEEEEDESWGDDELDETNEVV